MKLKRKENRTIQNYKLENFTLYHSNIETINCNINLKNFAYLKLNPKEVTNWYSAAFTAVLLQTMTLIWITRIWIPWLTQYATTKIIRSNVCWGTLTIEISTGPPTNAKQAKNPNSSSVWNQITLIFSSPMKKCRYPTLSIIHRSVEVITLL